MTAMEKANHRYVLHHLVKGNDLNHHGTLFAGRGAEWFVEAGFIAAASQASPEHVVCLNIHGMVFSRPVPKGSLVRYEAKVAHAGRTSLVVYVRAVLAQTEEFVVDGFLTFIHVDEAGRPTPHGVIVTPATEEDVELQEKAKSLLNKK